MSTVKKANSVNHPSKFILKLLFKEILEQIPPEDAESLTMAYEQKREIGFRIRENSRGIGYKTAFHPFVEPGQAVSTPMNEIEAMAANKCRVCDRELTNGKCVFINHKN
ncbi:MAG: hypothetical protein WB799_17995 [Candidatus Sulfotelmatobacter sp.]